MYGLVFLFKYQSAPALEAPPAAADDRRVFFAQQVIPNACATQVPACLLAVPHQIARTSLWCIGPMLSLTAGGGNPGP